MYSVDTITDGKVIAFWSPVSRQAGVSVNVALYAAYLSNKYSDENVLVLANRLNDKPSACFYLKEEKFHDSLANICDLISRNVFRSVGDIKNNAYSGIQNMDIVCSSGRGKLTQQKLASCIDILFKKARTGYLYTLVDVNSDLEDESTIAILQHSDIVVMCLPQDRWALYAVVENGSVANPFKTGDGKVVYVVGNYMDYKHLDTSAISTIINKSIINIKSNAVIKQGTDERSIHQLMENLFRKAVKPAKFKLGKSDKADNSIIAELSAIEQKIKSTVKAVDMYKAGILIEEQTKKEDEAQRYLSKMKKMRGVIDGAKSVMSDTQIGADIDDDAIEIDEMSDTDTSMDTWEVPKDSVVFGEERENESITIDKPYTLVDIGSDSVDEVDESLVFGED